MVGDYKFHLALAVREPDELNLFIWVTRCRRS